MYIKAKANKSSVGKFGEDFTANYLERTLGWEILCRNWRCRRGELDLVALERDEIVVCEVRTRRDTDVSIAVESVVGRKLSRLKFLVEFFASSVRIDTFPCELQPAVKHALAAEKIRLDVIGLACIHYQVAHLKHIRNAFQF